MEQWESGCQGLANRRMILVAHAPWSGSGGTPSGCWPRAGRQRRRREAVFGSVVDRTHHRPVERRPSVEGGPAALIFEQSGGSTPPRLTRGSGTELKLADAGVAGAGRYPTGQLVLERSRQFVWERFGTSLSRSSCLNWLHRLGFAFKRAQDSGCMPGGRGQTEVIRGGVRRSCGRRLERTEARIFFADEAHFRADAELRGKWVLRG